MMNSTTSRGERRTIVTPLRALVAGVVVGVTVTAIVSAHDTSSDTATGVADAEVVRPTRDIIAPGEQLADVAPISGPNGEILLDTQGRVLVFDPSKMTPAAVAEFNRLAEQTGTAIEAPDDGSEAVIVYNEHLPELAAVGAVRSLEPGDVALARFCTTDSLDDATCAVMTDAGLADAESNGDALRVDPATFRPPARP